MSVRSDVITAFYTRINDALSDSTVEVGEVVSDIARPGHSLVVIQPGSESQWDAGGLVSEFRDFGITVQMARTRQRSEDSLQAWLALEAILTQVINAVETAPIDGTASIVREDIDASEQPIGGQAAGLEITWSVRYAAEPVG